MFVPAASLGMAPGYGYGAPAGYTNAGYPQGGVYQQQPPAGF